ncbi:MAG: HAD family hydrolase [Thermoplasmata archaeon]|nr:HAD family hydrolase [Thermoplasmata archaeon]
MNSRKEEVGWKELEAMTIDVDATLYNYPRMMIPRLFKWGWNVYWIYQLTKARQVIRKEGVQTDFRKRQAEIISEQTSRDFNRCYSMIEKVLYNGWNVDFKTVKPYKGTKEFLRKAVDNGINIAVVTDYPPHKKLEYMGFMELPWTAIIEGEELGALKPSPIPFQAALRELGLEDAPEKVLHVGDSYNYDVIGAHAVGMKTAWLCRKWRFSKMPWGKETHEDNLQPDIVFKDWVKFTGEMVRLCRWE